MQRTPILFSTFVFLSFAILTACSDMERSDNGNLDGYWKLTAIDTLATGGISDLTEEQRFWAVQHHLITISGYAFRFERTDSTLTLYDGYRYNSSDIHPGIDDMENLHPFGVHAQPETFHIDHLSHTHMTLKTEELRLVFKKF